jgi:redox-sensitive bicupin YhaK (pirin superfamily)
MSNLDPAPQPVTLAPGRGRGPAVHQAPGVVEARKAAVGDGTEVRRLLPQRTLRTIGAWCFLDHYGPDDISAGPGMQGGRFFVAGGAPFTERLVMWWNFVARTGAEIARYRADWAAGRFGEVRGYPGEPLAAPPLPALPLRPR